MENSAPNTPKSYKLALKQQTALIQRYEALRTEVQARSCASKLSAFVAALGKRTCSVNMSIPSCTRFLETGRWFNLYEAVAADTGKTGQALEKAVRKRIPKWYTQRRDFERLLRFRRDTHYTALNLGGPGAIRYDVCCVVFDIERFSGFSTCFGGDSLRTAFDQAGTRVLGDQDILALFAVQEDLPLLAATRHSHVILNGRPSLSPTELRGILENSDSLIEIYLHGPVVRAHLRHIAMERRELVHLWDLTLRADRYGVPWQEAYEYDRVEPFKRLIALIEEHGIPLLEAEEV